MEYWLDLSIVALAAVVHATLQLGVGSLVLLYHESSRKHIRKATKSIVSSYIAGIGMMIFLGLASTAFVIHNFFTTGLALEVLAAVIGVLAAFAILIWFFCRQNTSNEDHMPRKVAEFVDARARITENNTEAFSLGVLTYMGEMPFVLVLALVAGSSIAELPDMWRPIVAGLYTIVAILPMIIVRIAVKRGKTAIAMQKWRAHNKLFLLFVSGAGFAILGAFIFVFRVLGN